MTILFSNHTFKYEIEATVKLFIPASRFEFIYDKTNTEGDIVMTRLKHGRAYIYLFAYARLNGNVCKKSMRIAKKDIDDMRNMTEYNLCKLTYLCLQKLTGITPPWGLLTGIRPVKKAVALINDGLSEDEVFHNLRENFLISPERIKLAYDTARIQIPLIDTIKNTPETISLYISIPFCPTRCSYCSFVSHSMESAYKLVPQYIEKLCDEIKIISETVDELSLNIDTIYIGGGTPTSLDAGQLEIIMQCIENCFDISRVREYNVEAGRADTITAEKLEVIKKHGATRISINPQTLNDNVLRAVGRRHTSKEVIDAFNTARNLGFDNINMDLIAGLPTENFESFRQSLDKVIEMNPENITVHTLTLKRSADLYLNGESQVKNPTLQMTDYSFEAITKAGYNPYYLYRQKNTVNNLENVGYSKSGRESLYNIFIMDETQTILGAGCAASTKLIYPDSKISRIHNYKFPYEYINRFDELMNKKDVQSLEWKKIFL